jgi:K+-transporting ATPase A subunit
LLFAVGILIWIVLLVIDFVNFFKNGYQDIGKYFSYQLLPLTSNVAVVFLTGVMQALTTAKEKDWMEKHADNK